MCLLKTDGTEDKSNLGANAILSVSMAVAKAAAESLKTSIVPVSWRNTHKKASCADDEYTEWRTPCG